MVLQDVLLTSKDTSSTTSYTLRIGNRALLTFKRDTILQKRKAEEELSNQSDDSEMGQQETRGETVRPLEIRG
jgi:hypothetical protein